MFEQTFKNIDDILHKDAGCSSDLDYVEQTSWVLFLKYPYDVKDFVNQNSVTCIVWETIENIHEIVHFPLFHPEYQATSDISYESVHYKISEEPAKEPVPALFRMNISMAIPYL